MGIFIKKAVQDREFKKSLRAKRILQVMLFYFTLKLVYSTCTIVYSPIEEHPPSSLYSLQGGVESGEELCEVCSSPSTSWDTGALAGELEGWLRKEEEMVLNTSAALKELVDSKENKSMDFKPAGTEWNGEKEKQLYWNALLKEVEACGKENGGLCGSELSLIEEKTIPGEEFVQQDENETVGEQQEERAGMPFWKKAAIGGIILYTGYKVYQGDVPYFSKLLNAVKEKIPKFGPAVVKNADTLRQVVKQEILK